MIAALFPRSDYPALDQHTYLNQASLGLIGQPAAQAMHTFLDEIGRHGNLNMTDKEEVDFFESLRERGARLLRCKPSQLAILASASEMLGQLPFLLRPPKGSNIVLVSSDFPAITRPWIQYAIASDCELVFVEDRASENLTDTLENAIGKETRVVAISAVQFATGSVVDIPRLRRATARVNAQLVIDATQMAGAMPVDAAEWGADAVVTSGYKWLGGHGGVALAALSSALLKKDPLLPGWMGTPEPFAFDATRSPFAPDARRFTQSTMSYVSIAGLCKALDQLKSIGEARLVRHAQALSLALVAGAHPYGWRPFHPHATSGAAPHIISLAHDTIDAVAAVETLRKQHIVCSARNGRIRVSIAPYTDTKDIDRLINGLSKIHS
ncbi:MAG: aminotransferase class V-fold PLP-dependent enzyme [Bacteroidota bacterium]